MMKILLVFATIFFSIAAKAQTDSIRSAKDYIKQREKTDPNMNGVKRSRFRKPGTHLSVLKENKSTQSKNNKIKL